MRSIRILARKHEELLDRLAELQLDEVPGIEFVGEVREVLDVLMAVKQKKADVVVASDSAEDRGMASHLLSQFPDVTLLILSQEGDVHIDQRCRHRWTAIDQCGEAIAKALRFAIQNPCEIDDAAVG